MQHRIILTRHHKSAAACCSILGPQCPAVPASLLSMNSAAACLLSRQAEGAAGILRGGKNTPAADLPAQVSFRVSKVAVLMTFCMDLYATPCQGSA